MENNPKFLFTKWRAKVGAPIAGAGMIFWLLKQISEGWESVHKLYERVPEILLWLFNPGVQLLLFLFGIVLVLWAYYDLKHGDSLADKLREFGIRRKVTTVLLCIGIFAVVGLCVGLVIVNWSTKASARREASATVHHADDVKPLLSDVQDPTYRDLVAKVISELSPTSRVSVAARVPSPDGVRRVDVEVTSLEEKPFITDIDVVDLPSGRPAGVEFVDAADSKRLDIKADAILVCSNTGFDSVAISKAKRKKIGLISVLRQGDKSIKAVIQEEIYLRKASIVPFALTYTGATTQDGEILRKFIKGENDAHAVMYNGGSVSAWLQMRASEIISANPYFEQRLIATFNLKEPTDFDIRGRRVKLRGLSIDFHPHVQWLSQIVQLDASSGIYDYARGHVRLATSGTRSYTIKGINFDQATPLSSPPEAENLGVGLAPLAPGEVDMSLVLVSVNIPQGTKIPKLEGLVRPEDLDVHIRP